MYINALLQIGKSCGAGVSDNWISCAGVRLVYRQVVTYIKLGVKQLKNILLQSMVLNLPLIIIFTYIIIGDFFFIRIVIILLASKMLLLTQIHFENIHEKIINIQKKMYLLLFKNKSIQPILAIYVYFVSIINEKINKSNINQIKKLIIIIILTTLINQLNLQFFFFSFALLLYNNIILYSRLREILLENMPLNEKYTEIISIYYFKLHKIAPIFLKKSFFKESSPLIIKRNIGRLLSIAVEALNHTGRSTVFLGAVTIIATAIPPIVDSYSKKTISDNELEIQKQKTLQAQYEAKRVKYQSEIVKYENNIGLGKYKGK